MGRSRCARADLAALLSTITVELPPLARRREDLPLLAQLFLEEANARGGKQLGGFTPEALDQLDAYAWPGNLDELAQAVALAHQQAGGPEITPRDLPERIVDFSLAERPDRYGKKCAERVMIETALVRNGGNKARASAQIGWNRPKLYRRMRKLGIEMGFGGRMKGG